MRGEVQFDHINRSCVEFRGGYGLRDAYKGQFGRAPVYNTRTKSWVTTPAKAVDFATLLETRGWLVTHSTPPEGAATLDVTRVVAEQPEPGRGLW